MHAARQLASIIQKNIWRQRMTYHSRQQKILIVNQHKLLNFAGNDYLGLAEDERIKKALSDGANELGFGSASSAMIAGYSHAHQELEEASASFLGRERAIFFNSGYHANLGVITTLANRHTRVIADRECHASILDGIILSRAELKRFQHHDLAHTELLLQQSSEHSALLITESVFSMSGSITQADAMSTLAKKSNAVLMIDDAHGFGVLGQRGQGVAEHFQLNQTDLPILITPLGKALGGMGAIVSGSTEMIEFILQNARTYRYSTAMPPAVCRANLQALQIIANEPWRVTHLRSLSEFFNHQAALRNLKIISPTLTPIKCILSGSNELTLSLREKLKMNGFFVAAIRPPTVPEHTARIRISLNIYHTESDIIYLLDLLAAHYDKTK